MTTSAPRNDHATTEPVSVLFVCLGNICRSTMAEGVFKHLTSTPSEHPLIANIDSAGTGGYHIGASPDSRTMSTLKANGIKQYRHAARKVALADFEKFDYIFGMDEENVEDLRELREQVVRKKGNGSYGRVMLFGEFGERGREEVGDPYYGGGEGFEIAYEQVTRFSKAFLKALEDKGEDKAS